MSQFLGPVHYWLYEKIGHQEALTQAVAGYAHSKGWIKDSTVYVKVLPALETVIDESNIHGWLQGQITDAEGRYANLLTAVLSGHNDRLKDITQVCFRFGQENTLPKDSDAMQAYQAFENFFVNGMPCDRVNIVTDQRPESVCWEMSQDIHAQHWQNGDSELYYILRKAVMHGMLSGTALKLEMPDVFHYMIVRDDK